jgi:hypothetical protein
MRSIRAGGGNKMRCGRMPRQNIEHPLRIFPTPAGGNLYTQHCFLALIVNAIVVNKFAPAIRLVDGPPGEATGDFDDVVLRISAVHTQRVKLHQLTRVVLIQATRLFRLGS